MRSTVLITGGAGFLGLELARLLLEDGHSVIVYDNLSAKGVAELEPLQDGLTLVKGDVRDEAALLAVMEKYEPQAVYHLAAIHYIPYCQSHPLETLSINLVGTQAVLNACRSGMKRLVLTSSAAVYGPASHAHAEGDPVDPIDIYGLSKLFAEKLVDRFHRDTGVPCYIARIFNVYGPGDTTPHLIPEVVQQLAEDNVLHLGNMNTYRDFIHVTDVARALRLFLQPTEVDSGVFNIGSGSVYSSADVVEMARSILSRPVRVESRGERLRRADRPFLQADARKMGKVFGWTSQIHFRDGLADLLRSAPNPAADARRPPK